jgi:hypothetical protein
MTVYHVTKLEKNGVRGTVRAYIIPLNGGEEVLTREFLHFSSFLVKIKRCLYTYYSSIHFCGLITPYLNRVSKMSGKSGAFNKGVV